MTFSSFYVVDDQKQDENNSSDDFSHGKAPFGQKNTRRRRWP